MTSAPNRLARPFRLAILTIAPASVCFAAPAYADTRIGMNVAAGATIDSNPYLTDRSTDIAGTLQASPNVQISNDVSSLNLRGDVLIRQFIKSSNGNDITGTATLAGTHRFSPYFSVNSGVSYLTSSNGLNLGFANVGPTDPLPPPTTPLPDITLGGTRTRTHMLSANAGFSLRASPRDQISANFTASRNTFNAAAGSAGRDFDFLNGGLNYSRTLSRRISATASVRYGRSNYMDTRVGDGTIITPEVGFDMTLNDKMTLSASLGASFSRSSLGDGRTVKATSLSGQARLCRSLPGGGVCAVAARTAQPTALGSINVVTSVGVNYNRRLSARDAMTINLGFNNSNDDLTLITGSRNSNFYSAGANWSRTLNRRLSMYVSPSYSRITDPSRTYDSLRLAIGLRLSFGAT
jgi:hypothetical protein